MEDTVSVVVPPDVKDLDSAGASGAFVSTFTSGFFVFVPKNCSSDDCLRGSGDPALIFFCIGVGGPAPGGSGRLLCHDDDIVQT